MTRGALFRTFLRTYRNKEELKLEYDLNYDVSTDLFNDAVLYLSIGFNQINLLGIAILLTFLRGKPHFNVDIVGLSKLGTDSKRRSELEGLYKECKEIFRERLVIDIVKSGKYVR